MSLVVTLLPGMPGYENHKLDYAVSNYNGEFGYRRIRISDVEFARYLYEQTGLHIDLGTRNLTAPPSKYMKYALKVDNDAFEPKNLTLLITPRRKPKIVKE